MTARKASKPKAAKTPKPPPEPTVPVTKLCAVLNLSTRRIGQLVDEGMPRAGHGRYPLESCANWYIRYLQTIVEKNPRVQRGVEGTSVAIEKARNLALDSELRELKLKEARGELISVDDQAALWEDAILRARSRSLSAIDGHMDTIVAAATRSQARDAGLGVLHEFLHEVVRLGDEVESEDEQEAVETEGGEAAAGARRPARPRRKARKPAAEDPE